MRPLAPARVPSGLDGSVERLNLEHPYDVPCVVAMPIVATSDVYRAWLLDQTEPPA